MNAIGTYRLVVFSHVCVRRLNPGCYSEKSERKKSAAVDPPCGEGQNSAHR